MDYIQEYVNVRDRKHYKYMESLLLTISPNEVMNLLYKMFNDDSLYDNEISKIKDEIIMKVIRPVKLISICGCHINDMNRIQKFKNMLKSWDNNIYKIRLLVSLSYEKEITKEVEDELIEIQKTYNNLIIINNKTEKKSQFTHFKTIIDTHYKEYNDYYTIFTDDDDLWFPERTVVYNVLIQLANIYNKDKHFENKIGLLSYPYIAESDVYYRELSDVKNEIDKGKVNIRSSITEYVNLCMTVEMVKEYVDKSASSLLESPLCDRYFIKFVSHEKSEYISIDIPFFGYGYYYYNSYWSKNHPCNLANNKEFNEYINHLIMMYYSRNSSDDGYFDYHWETLKKINPRLGKVYVKMLRSKLDSNMYRNFRDSPVYHKYHIKK